MRIVPVLVVLCAALAADAQSVSYDASGNTLPPTPPFIRYDASHPLGFLNGYNAPQSVSGGVYSMGPTDVARYTFWYTDALVLDHLKGVEISATLRLISEYSSNPTDRAGLAIGLTDDRNLYQELYIHPTEVFINKAGRLRDSAWLLDATAWHVYTVRLIDQTVTVEIDGVARLTGTMFAAENTLPNWAVVGDITSSARSEFQMTRFNVTVLPEPATAGLWGMAASAVLIIWRRRERGRRC